MPDDKPFDSPVLLDFGEANGSRSITSAREAADCLMTDWPAERGPRHRDAVETCLKVLEGYRSTEDARDALIAAAEESAVLAPDQPA